MRILIIADYLPYPLIGGDRIRIYNLLRRVASRHEVSLAAFLEKPEDADGVHHLQQFCTRVETASFQRRSRLARLSGMLSFLLAGKPMELNLLHSEELVAKIKQLVSTEDFDIVQIEHSRMGLYLETLPQNSRCKSILMFHNFTFQQYSRVSHIERRLDRKMRSLLNSLAMLRWEPRFAERFDRCATVSTIDRDLLLKSNPRLKVDVIPNGVDVKRYQLLPSVKATPSLLFVGNMGYPPSIDAVLFFCREIYPRILRTIPTIELWIVGRDPRLEVLQLNNGNIHVTGRVENVIPYYQQSTVCVVPLRAGGGTRLKILEAMALGRPVVSTTIGCEGLNVIDGEHLLIADDPDQFADKTIRILLDDNLYQHIIINGRKLVEDQYDWDKVVEKLMQVYTEMVKPMTFNQKELIENIQFPKTETIFFTDTTILAYHQITAEVPPANLIYAISMSQFEQQMRFLHENGYVCLSLTEALLPAGSGQSQRRKTVVLTFDDGYENFYTIAFPILRYYGFTATVFLIADKTFKQNDPKREANRKYLSWEQIECLLKNGISFGSHTCSHAILTKLSRDEIQRELVNSKAIIEAGLAQGIELFAYPFGAFNSEIQNMVQASGYQAAFGGSIGRNSQFNIRRLFCLREESLMAFAFRLSRFYQIFQRVKYETEIGRFLRKCKHGVGFPGRLK